MRSTIVGIVLAVAFVAAMFGLAQLKPHIAGPAYVQEAAAVQPGYVGGKMIGPWQFVCTKPAPAAPKAAIPFSLNPDPKTAAATTAQRNGLDRCRTTMIRAKNGNPKAIVLVMSFRYALDHQRLALIVRFPAIAQKGDSIAIQTAPKLGIKLPVQQCAASEGCLAAGFLEGQALQMILDAKRGVLVFPPKKDAKPMGMLVSFVGLKEAVEAMKRAES